ncbi:MAG: CapA family protein, partial [Actinomycetota bacterium]|nr:CapA family protein [Actinomycetota bacterium]
HADPIAVSRQGVMPRVTFTETASGRFVASLVEAIPTWMQDQPDLRLIDLPRALASKALTPQQRGEDETAHRAIVKYLSPYGAVSAGLVIR